MDHYSIKSLLENENLDITTVMKKVRSVQVHEINKERKIHGEYHHLFLLLKKYPIKFKQYIRMEIDTFDYVLFKIKESLTKKWCNLHTQPILPEEKLVICLR